MGVLMVFPTIFSTPSERTVRNGGSCCTYPLPLTLVFGGGTQNFSEERISSQTR